MDGIRRRIEMRVSVITTTIVDGKHTRDCKSRTFFVVINNLKLIRGSPQKGSLFFIGEKCVIIEPEP